MMLVAYNSKILPANQDLVEKIISKAPENLKEAEEMSSFIK